LTSRQRLLAVKKRQTLSTVIDSGDEAARADAIVVLNLLGARGIRPS
jgi:hypothetical protein